jgi:hypothetical protein
VNLFKHPLKAWTQDCSKAWKSFESRLLQIDALVRALVRIPFGVSELDSLDPAIPRLLIVDGLNEVEGGVAQELVFSLDEYAATAINTSVIVSDRFVRRDFLKTERWALCAVQPLSRGEIAKRVQGRTAPESPTDLSEDQLEILSSPYFLDAFLKSGDLASTRSAELEQWFTRHALNSDQLSRAAEAAYVVYGSGSRTFSVAQFEAIAGSEILGKLRASGALLIAGDEGLFDHHLKHDFLASRHLVSHPELWNRDSFNRVTFHASSFDAIMMCVEQVDGQQADAFIRRVYDWNIYGVGYALSESRRHSVSPEMRWVISAMFAERMWDVVEATALRARDTLKLLKDEEASLFLTATSLADIFDLIKKADSREAWFVDWMILFTSSGPTVRKSLLHSIAEADSVRGWTAANVLKRSPVTGPQQRYLRSLLKSESPVIPWRVVHALGAFPSKPNALALATAAKGSERSVRYGASRSLLEMASRADDPLRKVIFRFLAKNHNLLAEHRDVIDEIRRTMLIPKAKNPDSWLNSCLDLIIQWQPSEPPADRDKWTQTAQTLLETFATKASTETD